MTTRHGPVRLPFATLLPFASSRSFLARRLGVSRRTVLRWRDAGLTLARAEDAAAMLGRHPSEIWPEYDKAVATDLSWRERRAIERNAARRQRRATGSGQSSGRGSPGDCPGTAEIHEKVGVVG